METLILLVILAVPFAAAGLVASAILKPEVRERMVTTLGTTSRSLPGRLVLMTITGVVLLIPLSMVEDLRQERRWRLNEVQTEIATQWGSSQTVIGPMVWVPVLDHSQERFEKADKDGNVKVHFRPRVVQREFVLMPQDLKIAGDVQPQSLHRGLYDVLVYNAAVEIDATFLRPVLPARAGHELEILWHEAQLVLQLSDLSAVSAVHTLDWQDIPIKPESGSLANQPQQTGIRGILPGFDGDTATVRVAIDLRGMSSLLVGALGETSEIEIDGSWHAPSFTGFTLPHDRTVGSDQFSGHWSVPGVARPVSQVVELGSETNLSALQAHTVGVRLVDPASPYASVERALTYGMLVIALCLLTFLVIEHGLNLKLHPVQWLMNGMALVVFYLLLLAISEHQGFQAGYTTAATVTAGLISLYTLLATRSARAAGTILASLTVLYASLYTMLRSEDHALLTGTVLVVLALGCTMWVTRHLALPTPPQPQPATVAS